MSVQALHAKKGRFAAVSSVIMKYGESNIKFIVFAKRPAKAENVSVVARFEPLTFQTRVEEVGPRPSVPTKLERYNSLHAV